MTDRPTDLSSLPSFKPARRSLFSARKFAVMASVVAGLGVAAYGLSPQTGNIDLFTSPAHAQVNNEVSKVARPVGFRPPPPSAPFWRREARGCVCRAAGSG